MKEAFFAILQTKVQQQVRQELAAQGVPVTDETVAELVEQELEGLASFLLAQYRNRNLDLPPPPPKNLLPSAKKTN